MNAYETIPEARAGIKHWINFYNFERTHQSLDRMTPDQVYSQRPEETLAA
ncbi:MAG: integrase core domain-containing protein [Candidatus Marinimicrobia bacterium]|nr:integrase core domain-containing protein [Candidatus Neomarinimicrobiota bacterium]